MSGTCHTGDENGRFDRCRPVVRPANRNAAILTTGGGNSVKKVASIANLWITRANKTDKTNGPNTTKTAYKQRHGTHFDGRTRKGFGWTPRVANGGPSLNAGRNGTNKGR